MSHYKYDQVNREIATWRGEEDDNRGERFAYEPTNQLASAAYNGHNVSNGPPTDATRTVTYAYTPDKLSRSSMTDINPFGEVTNYSSNALNQYTSTAGDSYSYDSNFNLTHVAGFSGVYDAANHLVSAAGGSSGESQQTVAGFVYDGLGRCVKRTLNGVATVFAFDGWKPIMEWDDNGDLQAWNVYGPGADEILLRHQDAYGYIRFHLDRHGNVAFLLDNVGVVREKYTYDAFGRPKVTDLNGEHPRSFSYYGHCFLFQGREYIRELGIYDYRNRFYYPALGRFLQSDPIGFGAGDMNLFRYVGDDPVDGSDPTGLYSPLTMFGGGEWIKDSNGWDAALFNDKLSNQPAGMDRGGGGESGTRGGGKSIAAETEGQKVQWKYSGNWNDPNIKNHFADDNLSVDGKPAAAKTEHHLDVYEQGGKIIAELKINWWVRESSYNKDHNLANLEQDHWKAWRQWATKMEGHTKTFGPATTANDVRQFLDSSEKRGGIPQSRYWNEHNRQKHKYDDPGGTHDYQM